MGYSLKPIPFWTDTIEVKKVHSASRESDFRIKKLKSLGVKRLAYASLYERDDNGDMVLQMQGGEFIEFTPG